MYACVCGGDEFAISSDGFFNIHVKTYSPNFTCRGTLGLRPFIKK